MKYTHVFLLALFVLSSMGLHALPNHMGPSYDVKPRNALDDYAESIEKKYNLKLILSGLGGIVDSKDGLWGLRFVSSQKLTLEEARPMAVHLANDLISFMYKNPLFANYFKEQRTKGETLSLNDMAYKIAFWDERVNRPQEPYLAEIRLRNGQLYYFYADPHSQALKEPIIETVGG